MCWLWSVTDDSHSALEILPFYHLLHFFSRGQNGGSTGIHLFNLRSDGTHKASVQKGRDKDIPKASWTASSVSHWPRWRSGSHLTSPWISDIHTHVPAEVNWGGKHPTKELISRPQNWGKQEHHLENLGVTSNVARLVWVSCLLNSKCRHLCMCCEP